MFKSYLKQFIICVNISTKEEIRVQGGKGKIFFFFGGEQMSLTFKNQMKAEKDFQL